MPRIFKNAPIIIVILAVIALIVLMVYTEAGKEKASMVENAMGQALLPLQKGLYSVSQYVYNFFSDIGERRNMIRDYEDLQTRLADLEMELIRLEE